MLLEAWTPFHQYKEKVPVSALATKRVHFISFDVVAMQHEKRSCVESKVAGAEMAASWQLLLSAYI